MTCTQKISAFPATLQDLRTKLQLPKTVKVEFHYRESGVTAVARCKNQWLEGCKKPTMQEALEGLIAQLKNPYYLRQKKE